MQGGKTNLISRKEQKNCYMESDRQIKQKEDNSDGGSAMSDEEE